MNLRIGDLVDVISESISGKIIAIDGDSVVLEDNDGFERSYHRDEVVARKSSESEEALGFVGELREANQKINEDQLRIHKKIEESDLNIIDLHIHELIDSKDNLTNFEIVSIQMEACRKFIRKALDRRLKKVVIIHGKGEGVLRAEVHDFLFKLRTENEVNLEFHDADFAEFGYGGATEVVFY